MNFFISHFIIGIEFKRHQNEINKRIFQQIFLFGPTNISALWKYLSHISIQIDDRSIKF